MARGSIVLAYIMSILRAAAFLGDRYHTHRGGYRESTPSLPPGLPRVPVRVCTCAYDRKVHALEHTRTRHDRAAAREYYSV
jgi:hypothetical protein